MGANFKRLTLFIVYRIKTRREKHSMNQIWSKSFRVLFSSKIENCSENCSIETNKPSTRISFSQESREQRFQFPRRTQLSSLLIYSWSLDSLLHKKLVTEGSQVISVISGWFFQLNTYQTIYILHIPFPTLLNFYQPSPTPCPVHTCY